MFDLVTLAVSPCNLRLVVWSDKLSIAFSYPRAGCWCHAWFAAMQALDTYILWGFSLGDCGFVKQAGLTSNTAVLLRDELTKDLFGSQRHFELALGIHFGA